jgi:hypothetical protein
MGGHIRVDHLIPNGEMLAVVRQLVKCAHPSLMRPLATTGGFEK